MAAMRDLDTSGRRDENCGKRCDFFFFAFCTRPEEFASKPRATVSAVGPHALPYSGSSAMLPVPVLIRSLR